MRKRSMLTAGAGLVAVALVLTGCSNNGGGDGTSTGTGAKTVSQGDIDKAMDTPTTLTFWDWAPGLDQEIASFEKKYPKIKVDLVNAGQGGTEYTKLEAAIQAGKGAPDIAQLEYAELPSFLVTNSLLDLTPYGAKDLEPLFTEGTWASVVSNDGVYGIPQDSGPMTFMYRTDLFQKAGITKAPATWDEFATDAAAVKAKTGAAIADFGPTDAGQIVGILQQAGAEPFSYDGKKKVTIDFSGDAVKQVADYFTKLIQSGDVSVDPAWTDDWYQGFAKDKYAGWVVGAWGPDDLEGSAANTSGKWAAAPLPAWTAGQNEGGNWGGSADVVLKGSKNPIAAYEFVKYLNSDPESAALLNSNPKSALFPVTNTVLASPAFTSQKSEFFGGQQANQVFADIAKTVDPKFQFPPFWNYAQSSFSDTVGKAMTAKGDIYQAFQAWQKVLIDYGKQQGFDVN